VKRFGILGRKRKPDAGFSDVIHSLLDRLALIVTSLQSVADLEFRHFVHPDGF
jgi:hypothetical protein